MPHVVDKEEGLAVPKNLSIPKIDVEDEFVRSQMRIVWFAQVLELMLEHYKANN